MYKLLQIGLLCSLFLPSNFAKAQDTSKDTPKKKHEDEYVINFQDEENSENYLKVGGAIRFNAFYKNWEGQEDNQNKYGDLDFDTWRISTKGSHNGVIFSTQYRFYPGYSFLHHGWVGYKFSDHSQIELGITKVPFGLLPYASHNWFEMISYYIGLEDDHDAGLKWVYDKDQWDVRLAFFKNSEGHFTGSSNASSRYSYDVVGQNEEVNQGNARVAYTLGTTEIGISGQYGQLYNNVTKKFGNHYALAAHLEGNYGPFNVKAQALRYHYNPDQTVGGNPFVQMGAYDFPYQVAKKGRMLIGGLSYNLAVDWGPVNSLTIYNDFTYFDKARDNFQDSKMNVFGVLIDAGKVYTYVDLASGQSHPWIGPVWSQALARGPGPNPETNDPNPEWSTRLNLNIGYYF